MNHFHVGVTSVRHPACILSQSFLRIISRFFPLSDDSQSHSTFGIAHSIIANFHRLKNYHSPPSFNGLYYHHQANKGISTGYFKRFKKHHQINGSKNWSKRSRADALSLKKWKEIVRGWGMRASEQEGGIGKGQGAGDISSRESAGLG